MKKKLLFLLALFFLIKSIQSQTIDTLSICNGDSVFIFNNWQSQTGNYTNGLDITTLIVNPTPTSSNYGNSRSLFLVILLIQAIGFFLGALFLYVLDKIIPHLHIFSKREEAEGMKTNWRKTILLVLAIALHNIPEGLAVGVAFGALANPELTGMNEVFSIGAAIALAIGIGIQNFPEGFAVSMPLRRQGVSRWKSWKWGQLSAIVEPIFAVIGAVVVMQVLPILPYALAFAAGAMIFIVVEEVVPESQRGGNTDLATMGLISGFIVMMVLDVALG